MKRLIIIITLCLLVAVGAGGYAWWTGSVPVKTNSDTEKTRGYVRKIYVDQYGQEHKYLVFVPYDYQPGQKRPMLLFLHGKGESGDDGLKMIINNFGFEVWKNRRSFPFIGVAPQIPSKNSWVGAQIDKVIGIMDQVAADYSTDPDRVYVTGVSMGGNGTWDIMITHPDRFAAGVSLCGPPPRNKKKLDEIHIPIWNFINDRDWRAKNGRKMWQSLLNAGGSPIRTEYAKYGHDCWSIAYWEIGMYDWLLEQNRAKNARQTRRFELLSAEKLLADWESRGADGWKTAEDGALEYEDRSPEKPGSLISKKAYDACEIHLDVFMKSESSSCRLGLLDDVSNGVPNGYMLTLLFTNSGDGDLVHSTNGWIASVDPAAQHQLRTGYWNDVRVHFGKGRIRVRINGWWAMDAPMQVSGEKPLHLALVAPSDSSVLRWRNVRVRVPDF